MSFNNVIDLPNLLNNMTIYDILEILLFSSFLYLSRKIYSKIFNGSKIGKAAIKYGLTKNKAKLNFALDNTIEFLAGLQFIFLGSYIIGFGLLIDFSIEIINIGKRVKDRLDYCQLYKKAVFINGKMYSFSTLDDVFLNNNDIVFIKKEERYQVELSDFQKKVLEQSNIRKV